MAWYPSSILVCLRLLVPATLAGFVICSCGPKVAQTTIGDERGAANVAKVPVEAYLFDAVLKRDGKTTSFRLEMYATDTAVALAGRGYLGKGALRGVMGMRSLQVYFPTTNEYVDELYGSLLSDTTCNLNLTQFDPVRFMFALPDSVEIDSQIRIEKMDSDRVRLEYVVTTNCGWKLSLVYDMRPTGWRPLEITYTDGEETSLKAVRREYRPGAKVPASKFVLSFPPDAVRLLP
jgi:hypothetical protein